MAKQAIYTINLEQGKTLSLAISTHLKSLVRVDSSVPAMVTIGARTYFGAQYHNAEDNPERINYYLLGRLPYTRDCGRFGYQPRCKTAYTSNLHKQALSGGISITEETAANPQFSSFHPFGVWFMLSTYPDSILTHDNGVPYARKSIEITLF